MCPVKSSPVAVRVRSAHPWANNKFGCGDPNENLPPCGDAGAQAAWDSSFADTANENDNDISVDAHTGTIFMTGAAEAPNDLCEEPRRPDDPVRRRKGVGDEL